MDGVSSAFAVVSLAIQLVETGEKISKFLTSVQDAPSEVGKLGQAVDQLNGTLKQVSYLLEQQYLVLRLPGSPVFITNALENCEKRIKALEIVIQKAKTAMEHKSRVHKSWAAMKFVLKKEDIWEMQSQLRDAEAGLQTAMLSNSWQLQYVSQARNFSMGNTNRGTECIPSVFQALVIYKLRLSSDHPEQNVFNLYQNMRRCQNNAPRTMILFVLIVKRHIPSGIGDTLEMSTSESSLRR